MTKIAIVGGGFSGIAVVANLVKKSAKPLDITIFEKGTELCKGVAYSTTSPFHPLNVPAGQMGIFASIPDHFYRWLLDNPQAWRHRHPLFEKMEVTPHTFMPRMVYALYLQEMLAKALAESPKKNISIHVINDEVVDATQTSDEIITLKTASQQTFDMNFVVLAIGVPTVKNFSFESSGLREDKRYVPIIWKMDGQLEAIVVSDKNALTVIIGSGLTCVDAIFQIEESGYRGSYLVISKSGRFPQPHAEKEFSQKLDNYSLTFQDGLIELFRKFKKDCERFENEGYDWRQVFDAIRTKTQPIWRSMPIEARKQFMRRLFGMWNEHRHRMTPQSHRMLNGLTERGRLKIEAGTVLNVSNARQQLLCIGYYSLKDNDFQNVKAQFVLNCSGPQFRVEERGEPLVAGMLERKIVEADELGLGFKSVRGEMLAGSCCGRIFALGSLLFGESLETTAVPDIREQAAGIAEALCREIPF